MNNYFTTGIGRLRLIGFLEGISFLVLIFIAMPFKYLLDNPVPVKITGQIHGVLFIAYVFLALMVGYDRKWKFFTTTWKLLLASIVPFGTFYVDSKILKAMQNEK